MNLLLGWILILLGLVAGAVIGCFFHEEKWLGGYASLQRRMIRLGHVALVMLGVLNVLFELTVIATEWTQAGKDLTWASTAWAIGGVAMPLACAVAAFGRFATVLFVPAVVALSWAALETIGMVFGWLLN